jgi:predicted enzyme related to lactoylglutathione lyase
VGERTTYSSGTFSWVDLSTTDPDGAKQFYSALFGWQATDNVVGPGIVYSMMSIDGRDAAAISPQPEQQREAGAPPTWNSYITVESADQAAERAAQLGATVHGPPFDVMEVGRMAVLQDPQGAFLLVWEPRAHIGAALVNAHGALSWNELASPDLERSASFYSELFGWIVEPFEGSQIPYMTIKNAEGRSNGGMRQQMTGETVPYWLVYFGASDMQRALSQVEELAGTKLVEPQTIGPGELAVVADPQGATFALYSGRFDD